MSSAKKWLWQPPAETLEALSSVLSTHWAAAKSLQPASLWGKPASWLRRQATRLVEGTTPVIEKHPVTDKPASLADTVADLADTVSNPVTAGDVLVR